MFSQSSKHRIGPVHRKRQRGAAMCGKARGSLGYRGSGAWDSTRKGATLLHLSLHCVDAGSVLEVTIPDCRPGQSVRCVGLDGRSCRRLRRHCSCGTGSAYNSGSPSPKLHGLAATSPEPDKHSSRILHSFGPSEGVLCPNNLPAVRPCSSYRSAPGPKRRLVARRTHGLSCKPQWCSRSMGDSQKATYKG